MYEQYVKDLAAYNQQITNATIELAKRQAEQEIATQKHVAENTARLKCLAYLAGIMDGIFFQALVASVPKGVCFHELGVSAEQARQSVVKWLEDHPKELQTPASPQVFFAMWDAFPCNKK